MESAVGIVDGSGSVQFAVVGVGLVALDGDPHACGCAASGVLERIAQATLQPSVRVAHRQSQPPTDSHDARVGIAGVTASAAADRCPTP